MKSKERPKVRYPSPRIKGIEQLFKIIKDEDDWKPNKITIDTLVTLDIAKGKEGLGRPFQGRG